MITAIKLEDGSSVDIAPSKDTFNIYINTLGDILSFTIKDTEEAKALWSAVVDYHLSFGKNKENRPELQKNRNGDILYCGVDGDPSLAMIEILSEQLRSAAPQYTSAITFLIERYKSIQEKAKGINTGLHHYLLFSFSIAKGCPAH